MAEQTLNVPQLVVFVVVAFLAIRWYLAKPSAQRNPAAGQQRAPRISPAQIDQIAQMFPQLDRRQIAWDLQRNGGNASATTERVLSGRGLENPPTAFQIPLPRSPNPTSRTATPVAKPAQADLITRYNLTSKVGAAPEASASGSKPKSKAWSSDRNERQANLQRRREEMILAARRKMEQQEKAKAAGNGA